MKRIEKKNPRKYILEYINTYAGFRYGNVKRGTATQLDKNLVDEVLGFRSLCLFSGLSDEDLVELWEKSNLEFML